jgi:hypothetical protein
LALLASSVLSPVLGTVVMSLLAPAFFHSSSGFERQEWVLGRYCRLCRLFGGRHLHNVVSTRVPLCEQWLTTWGWVLSQYRCC